MNTSSLRTLFLLSIEEPYPPKGGGALRNWQNINLMMKFGSVGVFSVFEGNPECKTIPGVSLWHHCNIAKLRRSRWEELELRVGLLNLHADDLVNVLYAKAAAQELEEVLAKFQPDLVIADLWLYRYIPVIKRYGCRLILNGHNVDSIALKESNNADYSTQKRKLMINEKIKHSYGLFLIKLIERDWMRQSDQVWMCSDVDEKLLNNLYGQLPHIRVIPNGIDVANYDEYLRSGQSCLPARLEEKQRYLIYPANCSYPPNVVALELLIDKIYPRLRQVYPDCRLLVVGRQPTQRMLEAAKGDSGIIVTGQVPDVRPYLAAASVMAVPLRHGGGTRLKILEAFAAGCPVVSTNKGAEGLKVKDGEHLLIRDDLEAIVDGVCQLWSNPALGQKLASCAYELVKAEYSWEAIGQRIELALQDLF